ncbi:MAG: hypothetical protein WC752_03005 [Patescibacteria group bacterium]|jgi:hypothetical protein
MREPTPKPPSPQVDLSEENFPRRPDGRFDYGAIYASPELTSAFSLFQLRESEKHHKAGRPMPVTTPVERTAPSPIARETSSKPTPSLERSETSISQEEILQTAQGILDNWKGRPGGPPPDRKGDILQAYLHYGNKAAGISPADLMESFPGYKRADFTRLYYAIVEEAHKRYKETGDDDWLFVIE